MAKAVARGAETSILAVGTALPGPPVDNSALARRFGMDALWRQWVDTFIGAGTRYLSIDLETGRRHTTLAQLGAEAGRRALETAGVAPADVELMVCATATPDALMPATVNVVADLLGINEVPTYQLQSGCCGAYQAIDLAVQLLAASGRQVALVLGGESTAKHFDVDRDLKSLPSGELVNMLLFGDGAGAAVLAAGRAPGTALLRATFNELTGLGRAPGQIVEWFGQADPPGSRPPAFEDYKEIEQSVPRMARQAAEQLLEQLDWKPEDVDYLLPPQLSEAMTVRVLAELGMPGAEDVNCVRETANVGNAIPFFQLERLLRDLAPGDRVLGVAIESSKWIKAGFGAERV